MSKKKQNIQFDSFIQKLLNETNIGLWEWNQSSGVISLDEKCKSLLAAHDNEISTLTFLLHLFLEKDKIRLLRKVKKAMYKEEAFSFECRIKDLNARFGWDKGVGIPLILEECEFLLKGGFMSINTEKENEVLEVVKTSFGTKKRQSTSKK